MIRVMATGVFDIIHLGHIHYLTESKKLGDELVVVVARDSTAIKNGKRPIFDEESRMAIVSQLKPVDMAVLGHEGDMFQTVRELRPNIITLGYDQKFNPETIRARCREMGLDTDVVRVSGFNASKYRGSSDVRKRLLEVIEGGI